jgi:hypothetical protein
VLALEHLRGVERLPHGGRVGHDREVGAGARHARLPDRHHVVAGGITSFTRRYRYLCSKKSTQSSSRIAALSSPLASLAVAG